MTIKMDSEDKFVDFQLERKIETDDFPRRYDTSPLNPPPPPRPSPTATYTPRREIFRYKFSLTFDFLYL